MHNKELFKGTLSAIILHLLGEYGKMYGYELAQKVRELSGEHVQLRDGSLYPTLNRLLEEGALECEQVNIGKRVRKYYSLTEKGQEQKVVVMEELLDFMQILQDLIQFPLDERQSPPSETQSDNEQNDEEASFDEDQSDM